MEAEEEILGAVQIWRDKGEGGGQISLLRTFTQNTTIIFRMVTFGNITQNVYH